MRLRCTFLIASLGMGAVLAAGLVHGEPAKPKQGAKDSADKDYSAQMPRIPPKTPAESLKCFRPRPGFRIELVAAEPLVRSPVAIDFDEDGRMFVVEYPEYNQYADKNYKGHGCVRMLEDTNADGRYDKSTVYVDNLRTPTAVACYGGGIFVGAAPDILYCKNDGSKGAVRKVVYTGFGRDEAGESMLNSFHWGLDNRFHVSTNLAGGDVRRADQPNAKPVSVRGHGFLIDPRTLDFEQTGGGGQHGMSMDDWGRTFVCGNSDPIHLVMYDSRYLARNPYLQAPPAAINIAPGGKYTKLFRISQNEPWRVLRTRLRSQGIVPGWDEGGQPSGFFTGATGVTVYRGDAWPAEYRGNVFVGEVANNLVFRARLEPKGVEFTAVRADKDVEFLASKDNWFRPVQFANGPDGALYVIDMYRELIEGAAFLPPQVLKYIGVKGGIDKGRIYRIVPEGFKPRQPPRLSKATTAELVALLEHPNGWHHDTASRLLYEQQDPSAVAPLKKLAAESKSPLARLHALYALDGLKTLDAALVSAGLNDAEPRVREHALRLAERFESSPVIRAKLDRMTHDTDPRVRYQLAFSLGAVQGAMPTRALVRLALQDGKDSWVRMAILSSVSDRAGEIFRSLMAEKGFREAGHGREFLGTLAGQIGAANRPPDVAAVVKTLNELPESEKPLAQHIVRNLVAKQPAAGRTQLTGAASGKAGAIFAELVREARRTAGDPRREENQRAAAVRTLGLAEFGDVRAEFVQFLQLRQPQPIQAAALETLARFDDPGVPSLILEAWPALSPKLRATAAETLFSRLTWIQAFLDAVEHGKIGRGDVDPARIDLLQAYPDQKVRTRAKKLFASAKLARRQDVIAQYQRALQLKGDKARGKQVFKKNCSACHRLEDVGESVGADISAIRDRGLEAVMLNILDPNREVKPQYLSYVLTTDAGRVLTGMIAAETANSITIRRVDGTSETVLRKNIEELRSTGLSFMPEGLEKEIDVKAMSDLLAYLNGLGDRAADSTPSIRIVTLGDSITRGVRTGVNSEETFSSLLAVALKAKGIRAEVVNVGIGGERTDQALQRLEKTVIARQPQFVTVMYGTNDSYVDRGAKTSRITREEYRNNLKRIVRMLRARDIEPILMTEPRWAPDAANGLGENPNIRLEPYLAACREVARDGDVLFIDHYAHWTAAEKKGVKIHDWTTDGCHPNPRGHREMADIMLPVVLQAVKSATAPPLDFQIKVDTVMKHDDGKFLWYHPRVAAISGFGEKRKPSVVMTIQKHLHTSDHYSGLSILRTDDLGKTWTAPDPRSELDWRPESDKVTIAVADVTPGWHAKTGKYLAIGAQVRYSQKGEQLEDKPRSNQTAYAVFDPKTEKWTAWKMLEMPNDDKFNFARSACAQWLVQPDGTLLLPFYFGRTANEPSRVTVVQCTFDGKELKYQKHGTELALNVERGLVEPSLVKHRGRYYLTIRNDVKDYVTVSDDGLNYEPIKPWTFDDGKELGSYNTQQHWLAHSDGLFLVYTRRGANNDHIIRHRAPLFIARVDPEKLHVIRKTERVLIPERGGELGNFGAAAITEQESWVTVAEGVWSADARKRGAEGAVFVARVIWSRPNKIAPATP